ncbi:MAG: Ig-like domain-containing protein [Bacteroidales bacterium]|nr:Ig-like domain-containing protein [Bacteroidales bacterium]
MKKLFPILILFVFFGLVACENDDESSLKYANGLKGNIQKGPFINGSSVTIQLLNDNFVATGISYNTVTNNDFGGFQIENKIDAPYVEVITNGFYFNEVTGQISDTQLSLRSLWKIDNSEETNVNILTTLSKDRIIYLVKNKGLNYEAAKIQAQKEILDIFHISYPDDIDFNHLDISKDGDENAILLAISTILQGDFAVGQLSEVISKFILDIEKDGVLDNEEIKNTLYNHSENLDMISLRNNLKKRYTDINQTVVIAPFEKYVKSMLPLQIVEISPRQDEFFVSGLDTIKIFFNKPIDPNTITAENIVVSRGSISTLQGEFIYDPLLYLVKFLPAEELVPEEMYTIDITPELKGVDHMGFQENYRSHFHSYSCDLKRRLKAYYPLNGDAKDATGNGFDASIINGVYTQGIDGIENGACNLSAPGGHMMIPNVVNAGDPNWSYSIWVNIDKTSEKFSLLLFNEEKGYSANIPDIYLYLSSSYVCSGTDFLGFYIGWGAGKLNTHSWHLLTLVIDNSVGHVYMDGVLIQKSKNTPSQDGYFYDYSGKYMVSWSEKHVQNYLYETLQGSIDNVRFYDRALNPKEIFELYKQKK